MPPLRKQKILTIHKILKTLLISLSLSFLVSCGGQKGNVKVYKLREHGLVRSQEKEVLPFEKADGFFCETPEDFRDTITCTGGAVKLYLLRPKRGGIVRSQANEFLTYKEANGYMCVNPTSFKEILDNCTKPDPVKLSLINEEVVLQPTP